MTKQTFTVSGYGRSAKLEAKPVFEVEIHYQENSDHPEYLMAENKVWNYYFGLKSTREVVMEHAHPPGLTPYFILRSEDLKQLKSTAERLIRFMLRSPKLYTLDPCHRLTGIS